jgi:hypothetical protein
MHRLRSSALALLLCGLAAGCDSGPGEVSGTVRYQGKPLPAGTIQFLAADGVPYAAAIQPDGTYTVRLPAGPAKVLVRCVDEARLSQAVGKAAANRHSRTAAAPVAVANVSRIPQRYADWDASGLKLVVQAGENVQDFNLTAN